MEGHTNRGFAVREEEEEERLQTRVSTESFVTFYGSRMAVSKLS
jgi:hypothetical protein